MKFLHAADLHLDSPMIGLEKYEGAPVEMIRNTTREALKNLVDAALQEQVDFVVLAGDIYDGDWRDISTGMFFIRQMTRLGDIPVYMIKGNHDAAAQISSRLPLPDNVHEFSSSKPETGYIKELKVAIHGQSFATRAVKDNLVPDYPAPEPGYFNIGVLHTSINGREGHDTYAPCTVQDMVDKGYDYWALGHVHKKEIVLSGEPCWIVYPGNTQGRSIKEEGAKGCALVTVDGSRIKSVDNIDLDLMRWQIIEVDASNLKKAEDIYDLVLQKVKEISDSISIPLALRLHITGRSIAHYRFMAETAAWTDRLRTIFLDMDAKLWLEKVKFNTRPDKEVLSFESTSLKVVQDVIKNYKNGEGDIEELLADINVLMKTLPSGEPGWNINDDYINEMLSEIEGFLIGILSGGEQLAD